MFKRPAQSPITNRPRRSHVRGRLNAPAGQGSLSALGRRHRPDYWILILTSLLLVLGLVVVYSISPGLAASQGISQNYFVTKQLVDVGLGVLAFGVASAIPVAAWRRLVTPLVMAAVIGCLVVMVTPLNDIYPAHRWIRFGGYSMQIAELIKLALIVWLARFLSDQWRAGKIANFKSSLQPLLAVLLAIGVVVAKMQSDFGSAVVMIAIMGLMAYSIGIPLKKISMIGAVVLAITFIAISTTPYRRERLATYLHPSSDCNGSSYQACQALISVGSGGVFGLGLGYSVQAYGYLPEASNDSIFAIMAEKFGFIGSLVVLSIYGAFILRLKYIIERTADQFARLLVVGVLAWLSTQMIINIGAMLALLPMKGITLPLISQGGTSLIFLTAALGLVFQISRYTSYDVVQPPSEGNFNPRAGNSNDGRGFRRPHNPNLVARPRT